MSYRLAIQFNKNALKINAIPDRQETLSASFSSIKHRFESKQPLPVPLWGDMFCEIYPQSPAHITKIHEYSTIFQLFIYLINYYIIKSPIPDPRSPILDFPVNPGFNSLIIPRARRTNRLLTQRPFGFEE